MDSSESRGTDTKEGRYSYLGMYLDDLASSLGGFDIRAQGPK